MYNLCVVLARWGIFVKNDKCLVWNSLIEKLIEIPILRRPRTFAALSLLLRVVAKTENVRKRRKEPRWNLHENSGNGEMYSGQTRLNTIVVYKR